MAKLTNADKSAINEWKKLIESIKESTHIDLSESATAIEKRRAQLESDPEEWFRYYFPNYYTSEPAPFHKRASKRIIENKRFYEVRAWSRELAKSARGMMEVIYLALTGEIKNVLLISNSLSNAVRLLEPIKANFESNQRIIQDYGVQLNRGSWEESEFITQGGCSFRALGMGQSPRGTRYKNFRTDFIMLDDCDTDEKCRSVHRIDQDFHWIEQAVIPTMSVSGNGRVVYYGNIIGQDSIIVRAIKKAKELMKLGVGYYEIINIRDKNGKSVWAKNSESDIDRFLLMMSAAAAQKEFFNNPISEGEIFKSLIVGKIPPLRKFPFLVVYGDPAPGQGKKGSTKSVVLLGRLKGKLYVIKCFLDTGLNTTFIEWYVEMLKYINGIVPVYYYMENNSLQDPFFEQVFQPIVKTVRKKRGIHLFIKEDTLKKTDKATRIEANLEPLNSSGNLVFNVEEAENPHMQRMLDQFKLFSMALKFPADGPDCVEGGLRIINGKSMALGASCEVRSVKEVIRSKNKKRM